MGDSYSCTTLNRNLSQMKQQIYFKTCKSRDRVAVGQRNANDMYGTTFHPTSFPLFFPPTFYTMHAGKKHKYPVNTHTYTWMHAHTCMYTHMQITFIYYTHTHACKHPQTHTRTHIQMQVRHTHTHKRGDGVAQLVQRRTRDPKDWGSNPVRSTRNICQFFRVKTVQLLCRLAVGVPNPRGYTHAQEWSRMHDKDLVFHVRVWWITETRKDSACTEK